MPQTKQAKRLGAIERMETRIGHYRGKIAELTRLQKIPTEDVIFKDYDEQRNADRERYKGIFKNKIAILERDIAHTRAKVDL